MAAALRRVRGVTSATADRQEAVVYRDPKICSDQGLVDAVRRAGYFARVSKTAQCRIAVDMHGGGSSNRVSQALFSVQGVKSLRLYDQKVARVTYDPDQADKKRMVAALKHAGFDKARVLAEKPAASAR